MAKFLTGKNIGNVEFNNFWKLLFNGGEGITNCNRSMGVGSKVGNNVLKCFTILMKEVDDFTLRIALKMRELNVVFRAQFFAWCDCLFQRLCTIYGRFHFAKHVEVWAV